MTRRRLTYDKNGRARWIKIDHISSAPQRKMNAQGEDLTFDGYINKHGGIESSIDGKVYTTKSSYLDHVKANNCVIKDW